MRARLTPPTGPAPPAPTGASSASPWPVAFQDSAHTSASAATGPTHGTELWARSLGAPVTAGPVVADDGTIYESATNGILHAVDPRTGADEWTFDGHGTLDYEDLSVSAAVLPGGTVLWPAPNGALDALSPAGKRLWQEKLGATVLSPAVGPHGRVYVMDSDGTLVAIQITSGGPKRLWSLHVGKSSFAAPAVAADGTVYVTADRDLVAVTDKGSHAIVKWRFATRSDIEVSPAVAPDGTVVLGTNDPFEYGIRPDGAVAWRYPRDSQSFSSAAATASGLAYFGDNGGGVEVVEASTGEPVGRYEESSSSLSGNGIGVWTAPAVDAHHDVYFGTASGHIVGFSYDGTKLFDVATGAIVASNPTITAKGTLLIGSDDGTLYAFHTGDGP